jgi:predicted AAA+ superfamily ATPase
MEGQYISVIRQKILDGQAAEIPAYTRRDVHVPAVRGKAVAVIGVRRAGKTTFLWQLLAERARAGTGRSGLLLFSFEDERLAGLDAAGLGLVVEEYYRLNPEWRDARERRATFFFDEIQVVPGWEGFARRLLDTERVDLFISGSSARLLSREVATSMRGRAMEARVYPFSFREALRHRGREPAGRADRLTKAVRSALDQALGGYMLEGGFPEAQGLESRDRAELLRGYVDLVLLRDVIERHAVSHPVALRWMARQLLGAPAGAFSVHRFYNDLRSQGIPVAKDTLHAYLGHLEDAFLVYALQLAAGSERRRMVNPRKAYPADPGLIPVFERGLRGNLGGGRGATLETCVLIELLRRGCDVTYVRTRDGFEIDFLARDAAGGEHLIQVCAEMADTATLRRELRALLAGAEEHPDAALHLITLRPETVRDVPKGVTVHGAAVWLLGDPAQAFGR